METQSASRSIRMESNTFDSDDDDDRSEEDSGHFLSFCEIEKYYLMNYASSIMHDINIMLCYLGEFNIFYKLLYFLILIWVVLALIYSKDDLKLY